MTGTDTQPTCWTPAWLQHVTGGHWLCEPIDPDAHVAGLGIDTRTIKPGQAFLAIKGEQFDGHAFVQKAFEAGASFALVERDDAELPGAVPGLLLVDNTLDALHRLAADYRNRLRDAGCTVIAVVGSNGKTTTRNLIHTVLAAELKGTQSPKSFNNHIGVPLTLLGASTTDRYVVAEVGTNHPGEIDALGALAKPDAVVITCIGHEHMEFFGDLQGVAREEAAILAHIAPNGTAFIQKEALAWVRQTTPFQTIPAPIVFGYANDELPNQVKTLGDRQRIPIASDVHIDLPLPAPHDANNALAAVAVGRWMGLDIATIKAALKNARPMPGRLELKPFGPVTVIDDSYNANPDSMRAALQVWINHPVAPPGRRVAVLGDMLELGDLAEPAHRQVGVDLHAMLQSGTVDRVVLIGPLMAGAVSPLQSYADRVVHTEALDASNIATIVNLLRPGDVVLCKGSRAMGLERLLPAIRDRFIQAVE